MERFGLVEAASVLGVPPSTVKYWCRQRLLRHTKIGHHWLIAAEDLAEFIDRHTVEPDRVGAADLAG